jgi:GWxTD domain-containing protein
LRRNSPLWGNPFEWKVLNMEKIFSDAKGGVSVGMNQMVYVFGGVKGSISILSLALTFLFFLFPVRAEVLQPNTPESLNVWLDYACFQNLPDTNQSYVEIYYSFNRKQLKFNQEGGAYEAKLFLNLTITDKLGNQVENRVWNRRSKVTRWEETQIDYMILDEAEVILEPGDYILKLSVTDLGSDLKGEATMNLRVRGFEVKNLQLSDLELAFRIEPDTSTSRFTKGGRKILPNPSGVFTHPMGIVYFYGELYNLIALPTANQDYLLSFTVSDSTGKMVKDFGSQAREKPGNSAVVLSGINISTLPGGRYVLKVEAQDKETGQKAFVTKNFTILSLEAGKQESQESSDEVERFKQDVAYIATSEELNMFDQLTLEGKKRFIEEFWKKKDPTPDTPINEFKIEYYRRLNYTSLHFSRTEKANDGWRTDMGRIYILYGEPSEIERHSLSQEEKSWEQWNYNKLQGGAYFIFVDEDGYGVYRLVHSNLRGEVKDSQWEERVRMESPYR